MGRKRVLWQSVMVKRRENGFSLDWDIDEVVKGRLERCDGGYRVVSGENAVDEVLAWIGEFLRKEP